MKVFRVYAVAYVDRVQPVGEEHSWADVVSHLHGVPTGMRLIQHDRVVVITPAQRYGPRDRDVKVADPMSPARHILSRYNDSLKIHACLLLPSRMWNAGALRRPWQIKPTAIFEQFDLHKHEDRSIVDQADGNPLFYPNQ